jgi:molybdopterin converting factor subunit 1
MKVKVRLFARIRELAGISEMEVEIGEGMSVEEVFELVRARIPRLAGQQLPVAFAVNARYVTPEHPVRPGDEVAIIPPVSGGGHVLPGHP